MSETMCLWPLHPNAREQHHWTTCQITLPFSGNTEAELYSLQRVHAALRKYEASPTLSSWQILWFFCLYLWKMFSLHLKPNHLVRIDIVLNILYSKFSWNTIHSSNLQIRFFYFSFHENFCVLYFN